MSKITNFKPNREVTRKDEYFLTKGNSTRISDLEDGATLTPVTWATFTDNKDDGESVMVLTFIDSENELYSTISQTFMNEFLDIADIFTNPDGTYDKFRIVKLSGTSRANRPYVTCTLAYGGEED